MASFHFSAQVFKRSKGHSAVAAAAYRGRCQLQDDRTGQVQDYRRKEGLHHSEILLPEGAATFLGDRERLWNHVEAVEKRADAQLARELNMALPSELNDAERLDLVRNFAREQFVARGMVVDFAIHHPAPGSTGDQRNIHAHLMLTLRRATPSGLDRVKTREWNSEEMLKGWRAAWSDSQNRALERGGHRARVDHRRLDVQQAEAIRKGDITMAAILDRAPEIHVGPRATAAAQAGRAPASQERTTNLRKQPRKGRQDGQGRVKRQVVYPKIDKGPRRSWNSEIVERNRGKIRDLAECRERQIAQFRRHEARSQRLIREIDRQLASRPSRGLFGKRAPDPAALLQARRARALSRAQLAHRLVRDIERTLAQMLVVQRQRTDRHRALSRMLSIERPTGRGRDRPVL